MFKFAGIFIIYFLMLQKSTALFTCKTEYIAFTEVNYKTVHFYELLQSLQYTDTFKVPLIYGDNRELINLIINLKYHKPTKHIDVHHH